MTLMDLETGIAYTKDGMPKDYTHDIMNFYFFDAQGNITSTEYYSLTGRFSEIPQEKCKQFYTFFEILYIKELCDDMNNNMKKLYMQKTNENNTRKFSTHIAILENMCKELDKIKQKLIASQ